MLNSDQTAAAEAFTAFYLDASQREFLLSGRPGTGKTHLTAELIQVANRLHDFIQNLTNGKETFQPLITATTHKACRAIQESLNHKYPVSTIHSLLKLRVREDWKTGKTYLTEIDKDHRIYNAFVVLDEASYLNEELQHFIRNKLINCKILYIADKCQLLAFGEKSARIFNSGILNKELTIPQRFGAGTAIETLSNQLRDFIEGIAPFPLLQADGVTVHQLKGAEFQQKINEVFLPNGANQINKILAWTNAKVQAYNTYARQLHYTDPKLQINELLVANDTIVDSRDNLLCGNEEKVKILESQDTVLHGVVCQKLLLEIPDSFNKDYFTAIVACNPNQSQALINKARSEADWHNYFMYKKDFADLRQMYAATVYKAQGSTYDNVFIDVGDIAKCTDLQTLARMLLVAISRAKHNVYLFGHLPNNPVF